MATTDFGRASELQVTLWEAEYIQGYRDTSWWISNGFMGAGNGDLSRPVYKCNKLSQTPSGTKAVIPVVYDIGGGVAGDDKLEDNEAVVDQSAITMTLDQYRNGVKSAGRMAEQATVIEFRATAKNVLSFWRADVIDEMAFLTVSGRAYTLNTDGSTRGTSNMPKLKFAADVTASSTNRIVYAGSATSEATITASDTMSWNVAVQAKAFAKRKRIPGIRGGGREVYILVQSTEQGRDLSQSADYKSLVAQAMPRGMDNPLFTNAKKMIDDVLIYDHPKVYNTLGTATKWGGGSINGAQALLLGANALGFAELSTLGRGWKESDNTDYGNRQGIGIGMVISFKKPQIKSRYDADAVEDLGVVAVKTAAAAS